MKIGRVCSHPETRAARPTCMGRATTISLAGDVQPHSAKALQAQLLADRYTLTLPTAATIAFLCWGDVA